jgi:hypothetical protein
MEQLGSHLTDCHEILYLRIFIISVEKKFELHKNLTRMTGALHDEQSTFAIISRLFLLRIGSVSHQRCKENQTHILYSVTFFRKSYRL